MPSPVVDAITGEVPVPVHAVQARVLVVIPAFGADHLTDAVLGDLLGHSADALPHARIVVLDNGGDYEPRLRDPRLSVVRPGTNLRWIGSVNWALDRASEAGDDVCMIVNNDTRLSPDFVYWLAMAVLENDGVAVVAPTYDDFWIHQRAREIPDVAAHYRHVRAYREVPFCDGTGIAFSVRAAASLGRLDRVAFPRHGYGADIDYALRARDSGFRCLVTEGAYLHHLRRGTMDLLPEETGERNRSEILTGLDGKWGSAWRPAVGLSAAAFPPHNTSSAASWYA